MGCLLVSLVPKVSSLLQEKESAAVGRLGAESCCLQNFSLLCLSVGFQCNGETILMIDAPMAASWAAGRVRQAVGPHPKRDS